MVVVGPAARRVHGRGRHGVEREHELLSVAHAGGLGMVPWNTWREREEETRCYGSIVLVICVGLNKKILEMWMVVRNEITHRHLRLHQLFRERVSPQLGPIRSVFVFIISAGASM